MNIFTKSEKDMLYMNDQEQKLTIFKGKVVCPRCDGNGLICQTKLIPLQPEIFICDECEATWFDIQSIDEKKFIDLTSYLESLGYSYDNTEIVEINYDWYH